MPLLRRELFGRFVLGTAAAFSPLGRAFAQRDAGAAPGGVRSRREAEASGSGIFQHGVASGDPLRDRVVLWTRVTSPAERVSVAWEVATDPDLRDRVAGGTVEASAVRDFTVKVDARGLTPGRTYYYRFRAAGEVSTVGRTRTLPVNELERLRIAVACCASFGSGYFHGYRFLAEHDDLAAIVHVGDYIYEYGDGGRNRTRPVDPPHETVTLDDYRRRYACYRRDPDLQLAHARHPFIAVWDDHEIANDAWAGGAENHDPSEGSWFARRAAATRAYLEWMPIRENDEGVLYRSFRFGSLVELFVLDARVAGRDRAPWGAGDRLVLANRQRSLLGPAQETWLERGIATSRASFQLVAQQVMVAPLKRRGAPNRQGGGEAYRYDGWDGYPHARARLYRFLREQRRKDVVVLSGDVHSSWAIELAEDPNESSTYDPATGRGSLGVEMVAPGLTSPSIFAPDALARLLPENPHVQWADVVQRGYLLVDVEPSGVRGSWVLYDDPLRREVTRRIAAVFRVAKGSKHLEPAEVPAGLAPDLVG